MASGFASAAPVLARSRVWHDERVTKLKKVSAVLSISDENVAEAIDATL